MRYALGERPADIIIDLAEACLVDQPALTALVEAKKQINDYGIRFKLQGVNDEALSLIGSAGLEKALFIETDAPLASTS